MGVLPSSDMIPSSKFIFPKHEEIISAARPFTIQLSVRNFDSSSRANPDEKFLSAPQTLNATTGAIMGHIAIVIEQIGALDSVGPTDPTKFAFFRNTAPSTAQDQMVVDVEDGLPPGVYRLTSMLRTTNSAPVLSPIEAHGSSNDIVYVSILAAALIDVQLTILSSPLEVQCKHSLIDVDSPG
jgi:hypothetical protein